MGELCRLAPAPRAQAAKVAVAELAARQRGVVSRGQLERIGISGTSMSRWVRDGRLHRLHVGVYAVGHVALRIEGHLLAALIYAGAGSALSHVSGAWWLRLWGDQPRRIHVTTPARRRSTPEVKVYERRRVDALVHGGLRVTSVPRTLLDLATVVSAADLRRAVAEAEFRRLAGLDAMLAEAGRGVPGSAALRAAVAHHRPELALTRSVLEERFLTLCEKAAIPMPRVNARVCGLTVDALWEAHGLVVELDGHAGHATAAAMERDRERDLRLRAAGYVVVRYTWRQITGSPALVIADLRAALGLDGR